MVSYLNFIFALTLVCLTAAAKKKGYCEMSCGEEQIFCKYKTPGPSKQCKGVVHAGITEDSKDAILDFHNSYRQSVATGNNTPPAANMMRMGWDEELASMAQRWVEQCVKGVPKCQDVDRFSVGMNMAAYSTNSTKISISDVLGKVLKQWFEKTAITDVNQLKEFSERLPKQARLYSQFVWANSRFLGCGMIRSEKKRWTYVTLACNYAPAGNVFGRPIYIVGEKCSKCPNGTYCSTQYDGLCQA